MAVPVVGRDAELRALHRVLDRSGGIDGAVAIALDGEAGIGKSTLWRAVVEAARERGLRVLCARCAQPEAGLAYSGLGDLFDGVLGDVLAVLTSPQRRALEAALVLADAPTGRIDVRALGVAVRSVLRSLAEDGMVLAIDDVQWLDSPSADALAFALRRLPDANVVLVWTRQTGAGPSALEGAVHAERLRVGPLNAEAIRRLLPRRLSRATAQRIFEVSGGNPFYALELAKALGAERDPTGPLPVPESLEALVSARLGAFTGATGDALALISAHARLTPEQLGHAGIAPSALDEAFDAGVLELSEGTVRFSHPLLGSVVYQGLSASERRWAHGRIADLVAEPTARARHLAVSTDRPDAELACVLEQAADAAAPMFAAELWQHALRLTPAKSRADLDRRAAAAARTSLAGGAVERGRALASDLLARASPGAARAEALALMGEIEADEPRRAVALLEQALREPGAPPALRASVHQRLSLLVRFSAGLGAAERHARAAVELTDDIRRGAALAGLALIRFNAGEPDALSFAEEANACVGDADSGVVLAHVLAWSGRLERAEAVLERLYREGSERDDRLAADALWYLALVELRSGRLVRADAHAEQALALSAPYGEAPQPFLMAGLGAAHVGDLARARVLAERCYQLVEVHGARLQAPAGLLGLVELWSGEAEAALDRFGAAERTLDTADGADPSMSWWRPEQVESLLAVGRIQEAVERLDAWESAGRRLERGWVLAHAARCRGLVLAAAGDADGAASTLTEAASRLEDAGDHFGRARALLALGVTRRRARQKRTSREAIQAALAVFDALGAAGWADKARAEVARIGGRTRAEGLTAAEVRVAALVAEGRTNREVARMLFLGERTVEAHLTHIYAKLGVRSRTELASSHHRGS